MAHPAVERAVAIEVKWFPTLIKRTKSRQTITTVAWTAGLTPLAILLAEGVPAVDAEFVLSLVNDEQVEPDTVLQDGDRLEFLVSIAGG